MSCPGRSRTSERALARVLWASLALAGVTAAPASASPPPPVCRAPNGNAAIRVACLGNSNTQSDWQIARPDGFPTEEGWCERLANEFTTVNCGWGGATASDNDSESPYFQGFGQLDEALSDPFVQVVVLAYGTNDIGFLLNDPSRLYLDDPTPAGVADVIESLADLAEQEGALVLVATGPHRFEPTDDQYASPPALYDETMDELNGEILLRFPPEQIVDFTTGFSANDFLSDGLHVNSSGMAKRAEAAREAVLHLVPEPGTGLSAAALATVAIVAALRRTRREAGSDE